MELQKELSCESLLVNYINMFDVPSSKKSAQSQLLQSLDERINLRFTMQNDSVKKE